MSHAPTPRWPAAGSSPLKGGWPGWVIQRPGPAIVSVKLLIRGGSVWRGPRRNNGGRGPSAAGTAQPGLAGDLSVVTRPIWLKGSGR